MRISCNPGMTERTWNKLHAYVAKLRAKNAVKYLERVKKEDKVG